MFAYIVFWLSLGCLVYTYIGYPLLLAAWSKARGRRVRKGPFRGSFTIVLAAYNEDKNIGRRLDELRRAIVNCGAIGDIIVCADGCTDRTVEIVSRLVEKRGAAPVRLLSWPTNRGKAAALSDAVAQATGDIVLFADARQSWANDTIHNLLANFADSDVGAVSGDLQFESETGVLVGIGLYWRFEKWMRKQESLCHAQVGVTGAISGVRRPLFVPIPPGTLLDDVYWPLCVAMAGHRVVHDDTARAFDRLPEKSSAEFRRKVRTLAGNFQLVGLLPASLLPWRNPVWLAWVSRKLMRLVSPWALMGLLFAPLAIRTSAYLIFFEFEVVAYVMAVIGLLPERGRARWLGASSSFLILNAAAWTAFWVWLFGRTGSAWRKTDYPTPANESLVGSECRPS